jgi:FSR family fosmidomycin resistance protein-like MFS transporter
VQRATYPGIFVAPGALGLTLGILIGKGGHFLLWPILSALIIAGSFIAGSNIPKINYKRKSVKREVRYYEIIIFLLLLSVAIRALYGLTAVFEWKVNTYLLLTLTLAIVGGKALGGYVADTFGWMKTAIFALVISAPLLSFFQSSPFLAISGAFLFQFTMPITLTALSALLPGRSATAFGLAATTLIIGALPAFFGAKEIFHNQIITFITVLISAGALLISFAYVYTFLKLQNINV